MNCSGCTREIEIGDRYITDTPSGFTKQEADPDIDGILALVLGGTDGRIVYCEDCTTDGGDYLFETNWGDE